MAYKNLLSKVFGMEKEPSLADKADAQFPTQAHKDAIGSIYRGMDMGDLTPKYHRGTVDEFEEGGQFERFPRTRTYPRPWDMPRQAFTDMVNTGEYPEGQVETIKAQLHKDYNILTNQRAHGNINLLQKVFEEQKKRDASLNLAAPPGQRMSNNDKRENKDYWPEEGY